MMSKDIEEKIGSAEVICVGMGIMLSENSKTYELGHGQLKNAKDCIAAQWRLIEQLKSQISHTNSALEEKDKAIDMAVGQLEYLVSCIEAAGNNADSKLVSNAIKGIHKTLTALRGKERWKV